MSIDCLVINVTKAAAKNPGQSKWTMFALTDYVTGMTKLQVNSYEICWLRRGIFWRF